MNGTHFSSGNEVASSLSLQVAANTQLTAPVSVIIHVQSQDCIPVYASKGAAGADLKAFIDSPITLEPGKRTLIPTGIRMEIPEGYEVQLRPRSGLAFNHGITLLNTPGTIDSDYRGEVKVLLINLSDTAFTVTPGMRIAQMVVARFEQAQFELQESLSDTARGKGGFGHTGTH